MSGEHHSYDSGDMSINIIRLGERYATLSNDVSGMRAMLQQLISSSDTKHAQLLATINQHILEAAIVHHRVTENEKKLCEVSENRKDPISFWTAVGSAVATAATIVYAIIHGTPPLGKS